MPKNRRSIQISSFSLMFLTPCAVVCPICQGATLLACRSMRGSLFVAGLSSGCVAVNTAGSSCVCGGAAVSEDVLVGSGSFSAKEVSVAGAGSVVSGSEVKGGVGVLLASLGLSGSGDGAFATGSSTKFSIIGAVIIGCCGLVSMGADVAGGSGAAEGGDSSCDKKRDKAMAVAIRPIPMMSKMRR